MAMMLPDALISFKHSHGGIGPAKNSCMTSLKVGVETIVVVYDVTKDQHDNHHHKKTCNLG